MAYNLTSLPNTAAAAGANPYGDLIDDPAGLVGTPLEKLTLHDMFIAFQRMAAQAGITLNDLPDNNTNTYQFSKALGGEAWTNSVAPTWTAVGGGGISGGTVAYNKYRIVGKTLNWQMRFINATIIAATLQVEAKSPITAGGVDFPSNLKMTAVYNNGAVDSIITCGLNGGTIGNATIYLQIPGGGAFTVGAANQSFHIDITCELP